MRTLPSDINLMIDPATRLPQDIKHIVYENDYFFCVYDILHKPGEYFHYTAWCKTDIRSLLDIEQKHLGEFIKLKNAIMEKLHLTDENCEIFIHFPPSYWILHIHFVYKGFFKIEHEKIYLSDIIRNIKNDNNYYRKRAIIKDQVLSAL